MAQAQHGMREVGVCAVDRKKFIRYLAGIILHARALKNFRVQAGEHMQSLTSFTVFAIGLALLSSFPQGAVATAAVMGVLLLGVTLTMFSGAVLGLIRLPVEHD